MGETGRHLLHGSNEAIIESYRDSKGNLRMSLGSPLSCIWSSQ